jgi:hypothetical protein
MQPPAGGRVSRGVEDSTIDLCDRRGRLLRFVIAVVVGGVASVLLRPIDPSPDLDFSGRWSLFVVTLALFVASTAATQVVLSKLARRAR